ncbi:AraC family transcriptional regulator [Paenibacillus sp. 1P07SE]|uniref:AraC family transcriptional regulator n=1 Tax=Paenibacillus sp. 1P07SE TaxID=3132209 RepID=UPI0039A6D406
MVNEPFTFQFLPRAINMDLKLYYCGAENCPPGHSWGPGVKDHYKIHYVSSGKGTFLCDGKEYTISPGDGFLICPDTPCTYKADGDDPWSYSWVAFSGMHAQTYLKRAGLSRSQPVFHCAGDADVQIRSCFANMLEASRYEHSRDMKLLSALYAFLGIIIDHVGAKTPEEYAANVKEHYIYQAVNFIETNYSHSINIEDLARELNLNRKYMSKLFKEIVGVTPQNYLIRYRMERAAELMKNTTLSIGEIAQSVGYPDQLLFSRMFKKVMGASPRDHRKSAVDVLHGT